MMRKLLSLAAATAALTGATMTASVAAADEPTFSGNVALTTDYLFRGVSQTNNGPAVQGGFDYGYGIFYAGTWASNIDFGLADGSLEVDLYGGVKPTLGPVALDLGGIVYLYPNASDDGAELDYVEAYAKGTLTPAEGLSITGAMFYSPEFTGETGTGVYAELSGAFALTEALTLSGGVGRQSAEDADFDFGPGTGDSYVTYNFGGTASAYGFGFDLRYVGTDVDDASIFDDRVVFTIKRSM